MKNIIILVFNFCLLGTTSAQNKNDISGEINDNRFNHVGGATVYLLNTNYATVSNDSGRFTLKDVPLGDYTMQVRAIGFSSVSINIDLTEGAVKNLQITLPDEANQLDDVVVSAEKRDESLQKIAGSVTSLSSAQVQQYRLWNAKELTAIVPNMFSNNSGDERNVTSIRGITTTSYDPAVTTYVDGVNQFSLDTYIPQLTDVERIEVLRGPQGTLYGRNAMGGVINIITKQPTNKMDAFVELTAGNYDLQRYSAGIRTPLIKDKLFFGGSVMFNKRDGYYTNEFNNTSFDKQHGFNGNYYLKFIPVASWAFTINVKSQDTRNDGAFPLVFGVDEALSNPFKLAQNAVGTMADNTLDASLVANHSGTTFNFSSQTSWQHNRRIYESPLDADFSPLDGITIANDFGDHWNNVKVFTEELRFTSPANRASAFKWTVGSYFFTQDNPAKQASHFGTDALLFGAPDSNFSIINSSTGKNTGIAFYGQANYSINNKLELIAGMRYDYENKKLGVKEEYQKDGEEAFTIQPDTSSSVHFSAISPKLGLAYHATDNNNFFATYSRGYRTGGLTQLSLDPSQPPLYPYKPEYSDNIEA
ncbi:MAG TPA: TonB-dependent receptor, partial [Parafilimonas sp.]|nr:TonB-dependent receptor [Parafilimonas sp.]